MVKIAPSILSADFSRLGEEVSALKTCGADLIHIDIMDGHFVPNITIGPQAVKSLRKYSTLEFDVHLMIEEPERYIEEFSKSGADIITVHCESTKHLNRSIQLINDLGKKAGVSINPATPLCELESVLDMAYMFLIMSVNPGFSGQRFIDSSIDKIKNLKKMLVDNNSKALIEVDGGITIENAKQVISAGADILVAGSTIFNADNKKDIIYRLKNSF